MGYSQQAACTLVVMGLGLGTSPTFFSLADELIFMPVKFDGPVKPERIEVLAGEFCGE
jgi:hypothetical protein